MDLINKYSVTGRYISVCLTLISFSVGISLGQKTEKPFLTGTAQVMNGNYQQAAVSFSALLQLNPDNLENLLARARSYYLAHNFEDALEDLLHAEKVKPGCCNYELAQVYASSGNIEKAVFYLRKNLASNNRRPESEIKLDKAFRSLENTREWKDIWLSDWYNRIEITEADITYQLQNGENLDAISRLNELISKNKKSSKWYALRAEAYANLKEPKNAVDDLDKAISLNKRAVELYIRRADLLGNIGKWSKAADDYDHALKLDPAQPALYKSRALALDKSGKPEVAKKDITLYTNLFPTDADGFRLAGKINYDLGKYAEAIQVLDTSIVLDKGKSEYFYLRGISFLELMKYNEAIYDLSQALDLDPDYTDAWFRKGMARLYKGDAQGACMDLKKAGQLGNKEAYNRAQEICSQ